MGDARSPQVKSRGAGVWRRRGPTWFEARSLESASLEPWCAEADSSRCDERTRIVARFRRYRLCSDSCIAM